MNSIISWNYDLLYHATWPVVSCATCRIIPQWPVVSCHMTCMYHATWPVVSCHMTCCKSCTCGIMPHDLSYHVHNLSYYATLLSSYLQTLSSRHNSNCIINVVSYMTFFLHKLTCHHVAHDLSCHTTMNLFIFKTFCQVCHTTFKANVKFW